MTWLIASNIALLAAVVTLGAVVFSLARQIGVLHERTAPAGVALERLRAAQPADATALTLTDLTGRATTLGEFAGGRSLALLFVGPDCPVCRALLPGFERALQHLDLLPCYAGGSGSPDAQAGYAAEHALDPRRYFIGADLAIALNVSHTPTLVVIGGNGEVALRETLRGPAHLAATAARINRLRQSPEAAVSAGRQAQ